MSPARGYTLVELLVALALLSLCSVLMAQGIRLGMRAWDAVDARLSRAEAVMVAQQALRGRLEQAYPYGTSAGASGQSLHGQPTELSFSAPGPHDQAGLMLRYRVYWQASNSGGALKVAWQADPGPGSRVNAAAAVAGAAEETLLEDVESVAFEYFSHGDHDQGAWVSSWTNKAELPQLVRLKLRFAHGRAGDWPALVVRLRISMPADCQFDAVSRRCR